MTPSTPDWPFVARQDEQERFAAIVASSARAKAEDVPSDVVLVEGLGGFGKTTLLERFGEIAEGTFEMPPLPDPDVRVVAVNWQDQRDRHATLFSVASGPYLLTVLLALQGAVFDSVMLGRTKLPRACAQAFDEFGKVAARAPELKSIAEQTERDAAAAAAERARQFGGVEALAKTVVDMTPASPVAALAGSLAQMASEAGRRRGRRSTIQQIDEAARFEEALARTFARGLRELSREKPIVLLLDTYEIVSHIGQWLREMSRHTGERVVWVLGGRIESERLAGESSEAAAFRRHLPEGRLRVIPVTAFGDDTVRRLLDPVLDPEVKGPQTMTRIMEVTRGIPMAVRLVARMLAQGREIDEVLRPVTKDGDGSYVVQKLAERYLKHVRDDPALRDDGRLLNGLALLHRDRSDPAVLRALWDHTGSTDETLSELASRHDFVLTGTRRLHQDVRDTIRAYLLDAVRRDEVQPANERARLVLAERVAGMPGDLESLLVSDDWRAAQIAMLWHAFWVDNDQGFATLAAVVPAAVLLEPGFARDLVEVASYFTDTLTHDQQRRLRGIGSLLSYGTLVDTWLARRAAEPQTPRLRGFLGRLHEDATRSDTDEALSYLARMSRESAIQDGGTAPASIVALLTARQSGDPEARLVQLERAAAGISRDSRLSREIARVASDIRQDLRARAVSVDPDLLVRAATVDEGLPLDQTGVDGLMTYTSFLRRAADLPDLVEALYARAASEDPNNANILGDHATFVMADNGDPDRIERLYEQALAADLQNPNNLSNYALFLSRVRHDHDRAQELYERAIAAGGKASVLASYAIFVTNVRSDYDRAQELYERAITADPNHPNNLYNYALFLTNVRKDHDYAHALYERAIAAGGTAGIFGSYAIFAGNVLGDAEKAQELYERAITADPNHPNNLSNYALFLSNIRGDHDRAHALYERAIAAGGTAGIFGSYAIFAGNVLSDAEKAQELYERAITADPNHPNNLSYYALFLSNIRGDHDRAQELFERAIAADPDHTNSLRNYASMLAGTRRDHDRAQELYERAVATDPTSALSLGSFAAFLSDFRGDHDRAQELYDQAIAANPDHALVLGTYALFLADVRKDHDRAEELYERAIAASPDHASILGNYASLLTEVREDHDRAEELYERAVVANPNHPNNLSNYALFLSRVRGDHDRAQELYERAIAAAPDHAGVLGSYALFTKNVRRDHDRAQKLYEQAVAANPNHPNNLSNYAIFLTDVRKDQDRAREFHERAIAAAPDHANNLGNYARWLLEHDADDQAFVLIDRAERLPTAAQESLQLELGLYRLALDPKVDRELVLGRLRGLITAGHRSPGWDFSGICRRARDRHLEDIEWVTKLADVIGDQIPETELRGWSAWDQA